MNKRLVELIREEYRKLIGEKNSWGKNEAVRIMDEAIANATVRLLDEM